MARLLGVKITNYAFGLGPRLFSFRRRGTQYLLRAIPWGASIRIHGMDPHQAGLKPLDIVSYAEQPTWKRLAIIYSGPLLNALVAWLVFVSLYVSGTHVPLPMTIGTVTPGSEAARAQLRPGDVIETANTLSIQRWSQLQDIVADNNQQPLTFRIRRAEKTFESTVHPHADPGKVPHLGVTQQYVFRRFPFKAACQQAILQMGRLVQQIAYLVTKPATLPAMMVQSSESQSFGWTTAVRLFGSLSWMLALFYLLPIPSLDGGKGLFVILETLTHRRVPAALETLLQTIGFFVLLGGAVFLFIRHVRLQLN